MSFMLDTNVINLLVKGKLTPTDLPPGQYFATHIQRDELDATSDDALRTDLLSMFHAVPQGLIATSSFALGLSRLGEACLTSESSRFEAMLMRLVELDRKAGKRLSAENQRRDVLIAETAITNDLTLLTKDESLATMTREFGGKARGNWGRNRVSLRR